MKTTKKTAAAATDAKADAKLEAKPEATAKKGAKEKKAAKGAKVAEKKLEAKPDKKAAKKTLAELKAEAKEKIEKKHAGREKVHGALHAGTKRAKLVDMLMHANGTTVEEVMKALDWTPRCARSSIRHLRALGFTVEHLSRSEHRFKITKEPAAKAA